MSLDRKKPLDHAFLESMRSRIEIARILDKLQACVNGAQMMDKEQIAAARILLGKVMPDLKAVEHAEAPKREMTREELIERLTALHARPAANFERQPAQGDAADIDGNQISH